MAVKNLMTVVLLLGFVSQAFAHGYITSPPGRNSAWRFGFDTPVNYNDNEIRCGGVPQKKFEDFTCGVCGDHPDHSAPEYVHPGLYATGTITKTFTEGQTFTAKVKITANHKGFFEFRVGKIGTPPMTHSKFTHLLELAEGGTKWNLPDGNQEFSLDLKLPDGLVCDHCVMQWWWKDGNSWGCDETGCGLGLGLQETFVNCADIRILPQSGTLPPTEPPSTQAPAPSTQAPAPSTQAPAPSTQAPAPSTQAPAPSTQTPIPSTQPPVTSSPGGCVAAGAWAGNSGMDSWCALNCAVGNCPPSHCVCS